MTETPKQRLEAWLNAPNDPPTLQHLMFCLVETLGDELNALQKQIDQLKRESNVSRPIIIKRDGPKVTDRVRDGGIGQWDRHDA